jgi:hypothetical protein
MFLNLSISPEPSFGHYTATERVRIGRAFRDKNLGTRLSDRIADIIHNSSRKQRA